MKKQILLCALVIMFGCIYAADELDPLGDLGNLYWGISADTVSHRYEASVVDFNEFAIVCNGEYLGHPAYVMYIFSDDGLSMITHNLLVESEEAEPFFAMYDEIRTHLMNSYGKPTEDQEIGTDIAKEELFNEISSGQKQLNTFWVVGDTRLVLSLKKSRVSEYPVSIVVLYSHNQ